MTIGLVGQVDHDNFGDILILAIYVNWVNEIFGAPPIIFNPSEIFAARLEQMGCRFTKTSSLAEFSKKSDVAVFVGGGYLGRPDYSDIFWQLRWRKNRTFLRVAEHLINSNTPYYIEGAEIGPGLRPLVHKDAKLIIENAKGVAARNTGSMKYLRAQFSPRDFDYVPDVVLGLKGQETGISLPSTLDKTFDLAVHATGKVLADNILSQRYRKAIFKFIEMHKIGKIMLINDQPYSSNRREELDRFHGNLETLGCQVEQRAYDGVVRTINDISKVKFLITSKLHLGVIALLFDAKVACIASHPKLKRFYDDAKLGGAYCNFYTSGFSRKLAVLSHAFRQEKVDAGSFGALTEKSKQYKNRLIDIRRGCNS